MYIQYLTVLLAFGCYVEAQPGRCDQTPLQATVKEPSKNSGIYRLDISTGNETSYRPDQTYLLKIYTTIPGRPFRWFMITAEDPEVDNNVFEFSQKNTDVGTLKTLDQDKTRYSERCSSSVENADNSDKKFVEVHWVSPKQSSKNQTVRIRAMVAENDEIWYNDDLLSVVLRKNTDKALDSPPFPASPVCNLCSEARYEVIFTGKWSRVAHPRNYPSKPDDNGYSHMVGCSHTFDYSLWKQGINASDGLKELAESADSTYMERDIISQSGRVHHVDIVVCFIRLPAHVRPFVGHIIGPIFPPILRIDFVVDSTLNEQHAMDRENLMNKRRKVDLQRKMGERTGTRTLIRGKRRHHPYMSEPSHALFRVDRFHHLFSIAVGMRPSPDWFLGTSQFELCTEDGWLEDATIPLFPWDAGTMDGISYESQPTVSTPRDNVERVEVGSFNEKSPFYQINLNDLQPFAMLTVRRLDVFPLIGAECSKDAAAEEEAEEQAAKDAEKEEEETDDEPEEPMVEEVRQKLEVIGRCPISEWGDWSPCVLEDGTCGSGFRTRTRHPVGRNIYDENYDYQDNNMQAQPTGSNCEDQDTKLVEYQNCFVDCY